MRHGSQLAWTLLAAWAAFLIVRPYHGLVHDGIIYGAQTLFWAYPDVFGHDLFFFSGAQHEYSIFGRAAGQFLKLGGSLALLGKSSALLALAAWLASFWFLASCVVSTKLRPYVLVVLVAVVPVYGGGTGGDWLLHFAEPHFTPRIWAEALCLVAVAASLRRCPALTMLALAAAAVLHVLVAVSAAGVVLLVSVLRAPTLMQRKVILGAGAVVAFTVLSLAASGKMPFALLFTRYDGLWWDVVNEVNSRLVFPTRWGWSSWSALLWSAAAQLMALSIVHGRLRVLLVAVLSVQLVAFVCAILIGDLGRNALILSLQLWRVQWLGQVAGAISLGCLIWYGVRRKMLVAPVGIFAAQAVLGAVLSPLCVIIAIGAWCVGRSGRPRNRLLERITAPLLVTLAIFAAVVAWQMFAQQQHGTDAIVKYTVRAAATLALVALLYGLRRRPLIAKLATMGCTAAVLFGYWDHRDEARREMEASVGPNTALGRALPKDAAIVWIDGPLDGPWIVLGRSSYVDVVHATNVLFNRSYAEEYVRRVTVVADLFGPVEQLSDELIARVCARDERLSHAVVPPSKVSDVIQKFHTRHSHGRPGEHWVVACPAARANATPIR